jgi:hypothetical protein
MTQLMLFDTPANLSRKSDPITSQKSAAEIEPQLNGLQSCCMVVLGRALSPRTANEIAAECVRQYGKMAESYRKRLHELVEIGQAVECGDRACEVTGKSAMTFRAKERVCQQS